MENSTCHVYLSVPRMENNTKQAAVYTNMTLYTL